MNYRMISMDRKGIMDMPLKLMTVMIVLVLSVPIITGVIQTNERQMMDSVMSQEADRIENAMRAAYYSGDGSTRIIDISIPDGCEMTLGGDAADAFAITCYFRGKVLSKIFMERPAIRFTDPVNISGNVRLEITNSVMDGQYYAGVNIL